MCGNYVDRMQYTLEKCEGKTVLDLGCTGGNLTETVDVMVFPKIADVSKYCVGIDILEPQISKLQKAGYNVHLGNIEDFSLEKKDFEVVCLTDVIEHLANPGKTLENIQKHLKINGYLIISTANPWSWARIYNLFRYNDPAIGIHAGHTCWYDYHTLSQLLQRYGFLVEEYHWSGEGKRSHNYFLVKIRSQLHNDFLILAKKVDEHSETKQIDITKQQQITAMNCSQR